MAFLNIVQSHAIIMIGYGKNVRAHLGHTRGIANSDEIHDCVICAVREAGIIMG